MMEIHQIWCSSPFFYSDEDLDGIRHVMYLVGKNLGIEDEFNLCSGDLQDCKQYCHEILVSSTEK